MNHRIYHSEAKTPPEFNFEIQKLIQKLNVAKINISKMKIFENI